MNWLDIVILVAIAGATVIGLRIGIIKAALSLVGLVVGVILAGRYYIPFSQLLSVVLQPSVAKVVAFAIILIGVMVAAVVLTMLLKRAASAVKLGWADHLGGAVFGLVLGAIFCGAMLAIWVKFIGFEGAIAESTVAPILLDRLPMVLALLPGEFDTVRSFFQ